MPKKKPPIEGQLYANVKNFSDSATNASSVSETITTDIEQGNVITSLVADGLPNHKPVIDIDFPVKVVESSQPGHSHLYIDKELSPEDYFKLLHVMAEVGLVEQGFVDASEKRGYTALRLPWVKKTPEEIERSKALAEARAAGAISPTTPATGPLPHFGILRGAAGTTAKPLYMHSDGVLHLTPEVSEAEKELEESLKRLIATPSPWGAPEELAKAAEIEQEGEPF